VIRSLGFIAVRVAELLLLLLISPFAPTTAVAGAVLLDPLHERLRPLPAPDFDVDLRVFYKVVDK